MRQASAENENEDKSKCTGNDDAASPLVKREPGTIDAQLLRSVINNWDPHAKPSYVEEMVALGCPDPDKFVPIGNAFRKLRHGILLRTERLWVKAQPKDVVNHLLNLGPNASDSPSSDMVQPRRCRAVKVLDNPMNR